MNKQKKNKVLRVASLALVLTLITTCLLANTLAKYTKTLSGYDSARVAKFDFAATIQTFRENGAEDPVTSLTAAGIAIPLFSTIYTSDVGTTVASSDNDKVIAPGVYGAFEFEMTGESEVATRLTLTIKETDDSNADTTIPLFYQYNNKYYANNAAITQYGTKLTAGDIYINISNSDVSPNYSQITVAMYGGSLTDLAAAVAANTATTLGSTTDVIPPNTDLSSVNVVVDWYWPFEVCEAGTSADYDIKVGSGTAAEYYKLLSDTYDTSLGVAAVTADNWVKLELGATLTQVD